MTTNIIRETYLAAAEPSWAKRVTDWQLLGILNLSALLTPRVFLSDVHLGDNLHIFASHNRTSKSDLYSQIVALAQAGILIPLLRDRTVRPQYSDADVKVDSFEDVFQSWRKLDPQQAWINKDVSVARADFFRSLDHDLRNVPLIRYDYAAVKTKFMKDTRTAASAAGASWFIDTLRTLGPTERRAYEAILSREWFSLSDLYDFLQSLPAQDVGLSAMFAHGLINEGAYSAEVGCNLTGFDTETAFVEERIWRLDPVATNLGESSASKGLLIEQAEAVFDAPSLSLLSLLRPAEIIAIRELGRPYFDFAAHASHKAAETADDEFRREFSYRARSYWEKICEYIAQTHQGAAKRPRKMALFFKHLPWPLSKISEESFRFTLNLGGEATVGGASGISASMARIAQFVFLADKDEMKSLRRVLPMGVWSRTPPENAEKVAPRKPTGRKR